MGAGYLNYPYYPHFPSYCIWFRLHHRRLQIFLHHVPGNSKLQKVVSKQWNLSKHYSYQSECLKMRYLFFIYLFSNLISKHCRYDFKSWRENNNFIVVPNKITLQKKRLKIFLSSSKSRSIQNELMKVWQTEILY